MVSHSLSSIKLWKTTRCVLCYFELVGQSRSIANSSVVTHILLRSMLEKPHILRHEYTDEFGLYCHLLLKQPDSIQRTYHVMSTGIAEVC